MRTKVEVFALFSKDAADEGCCGEKFELELASVAGVIGTLKNPRKLGDEMDAWLAVVVLPAACVSGPLGFYERSAKVWASFRGAPVSALRRAPLSEISSLYALSRHPFGEERARTGKRVLRDAREDARRRVDETVTDIPPIQKHLAKRAVPDGGRAL